MIFNSGQIYRKDVQWTETNEKSIFRFHFLSYSRFCTQNSSKNWPILSTKMTISQKLKIANIRKLVYHSLQHISAFRNIRIAAHSFRLKILYPKKIGGQLHLPHPPPRLRPRTPHVFGLRTLVLLVIVSKSPVHC